jgi:hypothetical protein
MRQEGYPNGEGMGNSCRDRRAGILDGIGQWHAWARVGTLGD